MIGILGWFCCFALALISRRAARHALRDANAGWQRALDGWRRDLDEQKRFLEFIDRSNALIKRKLDGRGRFDA